MDDTQADQVADVELAFLRRRKGRAVSVKQRATHGLPLFALALLLCRDAEQIIQRAMADMREHDLASRVHQRTVGEAGFRIIGEGAHAHLALHAEGAGNLRDNDEFGLGAHNGRSSIATTLPDRDGRDSRWRKPSFA
jgi:hypothetical protein